jgi:hypothetical protein
MSGTEMQTATVGTGGDLGPTALDGPRVTDLLDPPQEGDNGGSAPTNPLPTPAGSVGAPLPRQAPAILFGRTAPAETPAPGKPVSTSAKDLAGPKPASSPITLRSTTQVGASDAGQWVRETITVGRQFGSRTNGEISFGAQTRFSNLDGKAPQLRFNADAKLTQTLFSNKDFEFKGAVTAGALVTRTLDGKTPQTIEVSGGAQLSAKWNAAPGLSLQATGGVNASIVLPTGTSSVRPFVDGRVTYAIPKSSVELYAGGNAEWTFPNEGPPSSASSLYGGVKVGLGKNSNLDIRLVHSLDGNNSSYPGQFPRDANSQAAIVQFTHNF